MQDGALAMPLIGAQTIDCYDLVGGAGVAPRDREHQWVQRQVGPIGHNTPNPVRTNRKQGGTGFHTHFRVYRCPLLQRLAHSAL